MIEIEIFLKILPTIGILFSFYLVNSNILGRWKNHSDMLKVICNRLISDIANPYPNKISEKEAIHNLVGFVYYHEQLTGREAMLGLRPSLVGLWKYLITPIIYISSFIFAILLLSGKPMVDYIAGMHLIFALLFGYLRLRLEKQEIWFGTPLDPINVINNIKKIIC